MQKYLLSIYGPYHFNQLINFKFSPVLSLSFVFDEQAESLFGLEYFSPLTSTWLNALFVILLSFYEEALYLQTNGNTDSENLFNIQPRSRG